MSLKSEEIGGVDLKIPTTYSFIIFSTKCKSVTNGRTDRQHTRRLQTVCRAAKKRDDYWMRQIADWPAGRSVGQSSRRPLLTAAVRTCDRRENRCRRFVRSIAASECPLFPRSSSRRRQCRPVPTAPATSAAMVNPRF